MTNKVKLAVHVPQDFADKVRQAIGEAGGGFCSFSVKGTGRFLPEAGAKPMIGSVGKLEEVREERTEVTIEKDKLNGFVKAIKSVHPYEEPTIDIYQLI